MLESERVQTCFDPAGIQLLKNRSGIGVLYPDSGVLSVLCREMKDEIRFVHLYRGYWIALHVENGIEGK